VAGRTAPNNCVLEIIAGKSQQVPLFALIRWNPSV
jgi:hypothetical protein